MLRAFLNNRINSSFKSHLKTQAQAVRYKTNISPSPNETHHHTVRFSGIEGKKAYDFYKQNNLPIVGGAFDENDATCYLEHSTVSHTPKTEGKIVTGQYCSENRAVNTFSEAKVVYDNKKQLAVESFGYDPELLEQSIKANINAIVGKQQVNYNADGMLTKAGEKTLGAKEPIE